MKKSILWKYDSELGWAYFCPECKTFICDSSKIKCDKCGCEIDWTTEKQYKGKVTWD